MKNPTVEPHQNYVSSAVHPGSEPKMSSWHEWLEHPEKTKIHRPLFEFHLWVGMLAGAYVFVMSLSGSVLVFRNQLEANSNSGLVPVVEWIVRLHDTLLGGMTGQVINGVGALSFTLLCITGVILWWPGVLHWRRSISIDWAAHPARINWDLHNALGFWCFLCVLLWGVSAVYLIFPDPFNAAVDYLQPPGATTALRTGDLALVWLSNLHFGRFNLFTEALWSVLGLVPAILAFTGFFMCFHRIFVRRGGPLAR
jgi:uncharacterized iron-regulated membrane protein